jgi:PIN domain nuclease of toxin-antitoxin system
MNAVDLVIDSADATMAGQLNWDHKDPFDRMLIAQALVEDVPVLTADAVFSQYGIRVDLGM